ncbi:uncharacterized protein LOC144165664 [Haemaphysalis longicornis]
MSRSKSQPLESLEPGPSDGKTAVSLLTGYSASVVGDLKASSTKVCADETAACVKHWAIRFTFPGEEHPLRVEGLKRFGGLRGYMGWEDLASGSDFRDERPVHEDRVVLSYETVAIVFKEMGNVKDYNLITNNCQHYAIEFLKKIGITIPPEISPISGGASA